jgi:hypothetical protein
MNNSDPLFEIFSVTNLIWRNLITGIMITLCFVRYEKPINVLYSSKNLFYFLSLLWGPFIFSATCRISGICPKYCRVFCCRYLSLSNILDTVFRCRTGTLYPLPLLHNVYIVTVGVVYGSR